MATTVKKPTLIILRGPSGSGKTTIANFMKDTQGYIPVAADDYFYINGEYRFNRFKLSQAHIQCFDKVKQNLELGNNVVVHNTCITQKELEVYLALCDIAIIKVYRVMSKYKPNKDIPPYVLQRQTAMYYEYPEDQKVALNKTTNKIVYL